MSNIHVVYAFSDNYYSSVATLNEMGAAWVMRCKWTGLLLPGFIFDKLAGCIDKNQICIKLDDPDIITLKQRLRQFRDDIIKVSAKYSCGFSNLLDSSIIVNER